MDLLKIAVQLYLMRLNNSMRIEIGIISDSIKNKILAQIWDAIKNGFLKMM